MVKIDWNKIEKSIDIILKENVPMEITFQDNGSVEPYEITDKQTNETKTVNKYIFDVIDKENNPRMFSTLSMILMTHLKSFNPLKDKTITINKFRTGITDFDIDYKIALVE